MSAAITASDYKQPESRPTGLEKAVTILTAVATLAALLGSYVILPYRVAAIEQTQTAQKIIHDADHDAVVQIRTDVAWIKSQMQKGNTP